MKSPFLVVALGCLLLAGCSDPQQPSSIGDPIATVPAAAAPLATQSDAPLAQVLTWVENAQPSERLQCYVDIVEGADRTPAGWQLGAKTARLSGWSVNMGMKDQPSALLVLNGPQTYVFKAVRSQREDVTQAEQFRAFAPAQPGVAVPMWLEGVTAGTYRLSLVVGEGVDAIHCDLGEPNQLLVR